MTSIHARSVSVQEPNRLSVERTLRLGNRELGEQVVAIPLEDAVPSLLDGNGRRALSDWK